MSSTSVREDREGAAQAKALDKVTDLVPDKLIDEAKTKSAMNAMAAARKAQKEAQLARERELASVRIKQSDVNIIMKEFEVEEKLAKRRLKECKGDMVATLKSFL
eukprot:g3388.t1